MAEANNKHLFAKLADRGEQVVGRITDLPGAKAIVDSTTSLGKRLDEVQKRLRSIDPLEKRVTTLEKRLDKLEGKGSTKRTPAKKRTSSSRSTTAKAEPKKAVRKPKPMRPPGSTPS
jgi:DNA anti-recombination protein RmuC